METTQTRVYKETTLKKIADIAKYLTDSGNSGSWGSAEVLQAAVDNFYKEVFKDESDG
jgi:hypothetical protein